MCSYRCRRTRKNRLNLRLSHQDRGYSGYAVRTCLVCISDFKPINSKQLTCSVVCRKLNNNARRNEAQKRYHNRDKSDPGYVLKRLLRTCITNLIAGKILSSKKSRSHRYCDFSAGEFKSHMESKFQPGMTWGNWGRWHVDHIRPLSSFRLAKTDGSENIKQIVRANSLTNLQPLWAEDNLRKHNSWRHK